MGVQAHAGSQETVWQVLAYKHEVYMERGDQGKMMRKDSGKSEKQNALMVHNDFGFPEALGSLEFRYTLKYRMW